MSTTYQHNWRFPPSLRSVRGFAFLAYCYLIIFVLLTLSSALFTRSALETRAAELYGNRNWSFSAAEGAMDAAIVMLRTTIASPVFAHGATCTSSTAVALGSGVQGSYRICQQTTTNSHASEEGSEEHGAGVTEDSSSASVQYRVEATGTVSGIAQTLSLVVDFKPAKTITLNHALYANQIWLTSGNTGGLTSTAILANTTFTGDIGTWGSGSISGVPRIIVGGPGGFLGGTATIQGQILIPTGSSVSQTVLLNPGSLATGGIHRLDEILARPDPAIPTGVPVTDLGTVVTGTGAANCLAPGYYVMESMDLEPPAKVFCAESAILYVRHGITLQGNHQVYGQAPGHPGQYAPDSLIIVGVGEDETIGVGTGALLAAGVYAPKSIFATSPSSVLVGGVTAKAVAMGGTPLLLVLPGAAPSPYPNIRQAYYYEGFRDRKIPIEPNQVSALMWSGSLQTSSSTSCAGSTSTVTCATASE